MVSLNCFRRQGRTFVVVVVVVVVVVMTSPSGTAYIGGTKRSGTDEEFHQTLNLEGSVSPSW